MFADYRQRGISPTAVCTAQSKLARLFLAGVEQRSRGCAVGRRTQPPAYPNRGCASPSVCVCLCVDVSVAAPHSCAHIRCGGFPEESKQQSSDAQAGSEPCRHLTCVPVYPRSLRCALLFGLQPLPLMHPTLPPHSPRPPPLLVPSTRLRTAPGLSLRRLP